MVVRPSPSSTRRCDIPALEDKDGADALDLLGQNDEEGCATAGVHCVQVQNATNFEALQTVRSFLHRLFGQSVDDHLFCSFELGGEKKTKGAALTFVCVCCVIYLLSSDPLHHCSECLLSLYSFLCNSTYHTATT